MKIVISVLAVTVLIAVLLLWSRSNGGQDTRHETVSTQSEPGSPMLDRTALGGHSRERPQLPTLRTPERRAEQSIRVEIDRRPWDPAKESESQYKGRAALIAGFDRFREDSGISEEKAQAIVALLYDYQETARYVRKQSLDRVLSDDNNWKPSDYETREARHTGLLVELDALDALEEILTPEEMRPWRRHMESISVWMLLNWPYEPPLIIPEPDGQAT